MSKGSRKRNAKKVQRDAEMNDVDPERQDAGLTPSVRTSPQVDNPGAHGLSLEELILLNSGKSQGSAGTQRGNELRAQNAGLSKKQKKRGQGSRNQKIRKAGLQDKAAAVADRQAGRSQKKDRARQHRAQLAQL